MAKVSITIDENKLEAIRQQGIDVEFELEKKVNELYKRVPQTLRKFIDNLELKKKKPRTKPIESEVQNDAIKQGNHENNTSNSASATE